jgi:hypothetical protein
LPHCRALIPRRSLQQKVPASSPCRGNWARPPASGPPMSAERQDKIAPNSNCTKCRTAHHTTCQTARSRRTVSRPWPEHKLVIQLSWRRAMAGNFFQKTLNGEPDTCWCVCVCWVLVRVHPRNRKPSATACNTHIFGLQPCQNQG